MARESRGDKARRQIQDLNLSGMTDADIGRAINRNRSTVGRWRKGQTDPRKGQGGGLTRLWKRATKQIGKGGTVDLTSFFRRVWVRRFEAIFPLNLRTVPTYNFPPNAPVWITAYFSDWVLENGQNWNTGFLAKSLRVDLRLGENGVAGLERELIAAMKKIVKSKGDDYRVKYARIRDVLLKRGKND